MIPAPRPSPDAVTASLMDAVDTLDAIDAVEDALREAIDWVAEVAVMHGRPIDEVEQAVEHAEDIIADLLREPRQRLNATVERENGLLETMGRY